MRYLSDEPKEVQEDFWRRHRESRKKALKRGGMIRLNDKEIRALALKVPSNSPTWVHDLVLDTAIAQLRKVEEELQRLIGIYSRTGDDGRVWLPIDEFRQALLKEME